MKKRLKKILRLALALALVGGALFGGYEVWRATRSERTAGVAGAVKARVEVGAESVTVRLAVELAGPGLFHEARVPILPAGVALVEAKLNGRAAEMELLGETLAIVLRGAGTHQAEVAYELPLPAERRLLLALPRGVSTSLEVALAEAGMAVHVPAPAVVKMLPAKKGSEARVIMPPAERVSISWRPRPEEMTRAVRLAARTETLYTIQGDSFSGRTQYGLRVEGKDVARFAFALAEGVTVDQVEGAWVEGWECENGKLVVQARGAIQGEAPLVVYHRRPLADGEVELAVPVLENAVRQWGFGAVAAGGAVELEALAVENGGEIDPRGLPASLRQAGSAPVARAFRYDRVPSSQRLSLVRHRESEILEATADSLNALLAYASDGGCVGKAVYAVRNVRRQHLAVELPEGAELWSVHVAGNPVRPVHDAGGRTLVPLSCSAATASRAFAVELVYFTPGAPFAEKGEFRAPLPQVDVPVMQVMLSLSLPQEINLEDFAGDLRPVESFTFALDPQDIQLVRDARKENPADKAVDDVNKQIDQQLRRGGRGQMNLRLDYDALVRNDNFQEALRPNGFNRAFLQQYCLENPGAAQPVVQPVAKLNLTGFGQAELAEITGLASLQIPVPTGGPVLRFERQLLRDELAEVRAAYWSILAAKPKADAAPRLASNVAVLYQLGPRALALTATLSYQLDAGKVDAVRYELPAGAKVLSIRGENVARWQSTGNTLVVHFVRPERRGGRLVMAAELPSNGSALRLAPPRLAGASSERALLGVAAPDDYEVRFEKAETLEPVNPAFLPPELRNGHRSVSVFRLGGARARDVRLEATRRARVASLHATCDSVNAISFFTDEGVSVTRAIYEIRNVAQRHLSLRLPEGADLWGAFVADRAVRPLAGVEGTILLPIELSRDGRVRSYPVEVVYALGGQPFERRGTLAAGLPAVDVPVMHAMYSVYLPQRLRAWGFAGSLKQVREFSAPVSPEEAATEPALAARANYYNDRQAALEWNMNERDLGKLLGHAAKPASTKTPAAPGGAAGTLAACGLKIYIPAMGRLLRFERHLVVKGKMSFECSYRG